MRDGAYTVVLTHDIDALSLVELPIGRTLLGFGYRSLIENMGRLAAGRISPRQYASSLLEVVTYFPAKLRIRTDAWARSLGVMLDLERRRTVRSTLFFIPVPGEAGARPDGPGPAPRNRAGHYRLTDHRALLAALVRDGWEVGVHGIDAWRSADHARRELAAFRQACPAQPRVGIRMHWLYEREGMWEGLADAGFAYDCTLGWNDRVGFPGGRYRPFQAVRGRDFVVLPLNIQDGALLGAEHGNMTASQAWEAIEAVLEEGARHQAVISVLWHNTSFAVPRFWGDLYERLLDRVATDGAAILTAGEAALRAVEARWS